MTLRVEDLQVSEEVVTHDHVVSRLFLLFCLSLLADDSDLDKIAFQRLYELVVLGFKLHGKGQE